MTERSISHNQQEESEVSSLTSSPSSARIAKVVAATLFVVLFVVLMLMEPAVPDRIRLLTGPEGSPYHELGSRYATELALRGLAVDVAASASRRCGCSIDPI